MYYLLFIFLAEPAFFSGPFLQRDLRFPFFRRPDLSF
jgi:hypothetical protein